MVKHNYKIILIHKEFLLDDSSYHTLFTRDFHQTKNNILIVTYSTFKIQYNTALQVATNWISRQPLCYGHFLKDQIIFLDVI
jgi:hypothetical protein